MHPADDILVKQSGKGDLDAFEQLVKRYQNKIYNLACRFLGNRVDAYDLAQETFIRFYQSLPRFRGESSLMTWLYRITVNVCRDELRRQKRRNIVFVGFAEDKKADTENNNVYKNYLHAGVSSPEEILERKEFCSKVQLCLYSLPEKYRLILVMREIQGMSYEEIAETLQCPRGTVKSRLYSARQVFRKKFKWE